MTRPSLNRRLTLRLATGIFLVWCIAVAWMTWRSLHEVNEIFDQMLVRTAANVFAVLPADPGTGATARLPDRRIVESDESAHRPAISLRTAAGEWLLRSSDLPPDAFAREDGQPRTVAYDDRRWRVFRRWDAERQYWIEVAAPLDERDELMRKLLAPALLVLLALLVLVPPVVFAGLRGGLKPLRRLTSTLAAGNELRVPVLTDERVPVELASFTRAVDRLMAHLRAALEHEQRFTADAAHELRHPLAALRLELDMASRADDVERNSHLARAQAALDRMQRLVGQLLMLARVERLDQLEDVGVLDLGELAGETLRAGSERASERQVELSLESHGDGRVRGSRMLLGVALQNLFDNALRHVPARGRIAVRLDQESDRTHLTMDDDGRGFADASRLGERFHRPEGSHGEGSGLGLSIVRAIVALHQGRISFGRSPWGGARVALEFPQAAPTLAG